MKENCIKLLGNGLSHFENSYRDVVLDISPDEQNGSSDSFAFTGEQFKPNSAEKLNLQARHKFNIQAFDASEVTQNIRTRNYAYSFTQHVMKAAEYLISVLELAKDINAKVDKTVKTVKNIKNSSKIKGSEKGFQETKAAVNSYIDILLEIKTRISDLETSPFNQHITRTYANLDTSVRSMLNTAYIPDEMAETFNSLYEKLPLLKFSNAKANGISKEIALERFRDFSERLYSAAIKRFLQELMEEFSYYVTPDAFLNNSKKTAVFVVPMSFYKRFNFQRSGLTREEVVFMDSRTSIEKTTKNLSLFLNDLLTSFSCLYEKLKQQKDSLFSVKDQGEIEWVTGTYEKNYCKTTRGNLKGLKQMLKNDFFREKFTVLMFDLRPDLVVEALTAGGNPWDLPVEDTKELSDLDVETMVYLYNLIKCTFEDKKFPAMRVQLVRLMHLFSYNDKPEKSYSRYTGLISTGKLTWSDNELGKRFKQALEK